MIHKCAAAAATSSPFSSSAARVKGPSVMGTLMKIRSCRNCPRDESGAFAVRLYGSEKVISRPSAGIYIYLYIVRVYRPSFRNGRVERTTTTHYIYTQQRMRSKPDRPRDGDDDVRGEIRADAYNIYISPANRLITPPRRTFYRTCTRIIRV